MSRHHPDRPPLDRQALLARLVAPETMVRTVEVVPALPSTNDTLADRARRGAPVGTVLATEHQTRGKGRRDRGWSTPAGAALTFSVLLRPPVAAGQWPWLPLLAGVATAQAVRRTAGVEARLKWPNDVLVGEQKLAGILVEAVDTPGGPAVVAGIGLNVSATVEELPAASATSLWLAGATRLDRTDLLAGILQTLAERYQAWVASGGDPEPGLRADYRSHCATLGRRVRVMLSGQDPLVGTAVDVDRHGRLLLHTAQGCRAVSAGDVVHLRRVT